MLLTQEECCTHSRMYTGRARSHVSPGTKAAPLTVSCSEQAHIAAMPLRDAPEVFGQHASADAAVHALEAAALLAGLAAMQRGHPAVIAHGASSEMRLLAITAMLLAQAQHLICCHCKHRIEHGWSTALLAKAASCSQQCSAACVAGLCGAPLCFERFRNNHACLQVPDAPELDAAVAAAATPRSGGMLLQAVLAQELERHASLAARVRRDATALERVLGGRTANTTALADRAQTLLAGQARRKKTLRHFM